MTICEHAVGRQWILLADEDDADREFLADNLTADGFTVDAVCDDRAAIAKLATTSPDLILVDVNANTLGLLDTIRSGETLLGAIDAGTPVIVLTSRVEELHRVRLLDRGSDDVVAKPCSYAEVRARVGAVLRRTRRRAPQPIITAGPLRVNLRTRQVTVERRPVKLSCLEYELLRKLASEPTRVFTRQELMADIWGYTSGRTRTLDSHVARLRQRLRSESQKLVINVWGVGYCLVQDSSVHNDGL